MKYIILFFIIQTLIILVPGCSEKDEPKEETISTLKMVFQHKVKNEYVQYNEILYTNAAGNPFEISEIMYFISELKLYKEGIPYNISQWDNVHYIDSNLPQTLEWNVNYNIPAGKYDSLTFIFGLSEEMNKSFLFVNPPEVNMAWPQVLGGGYHYLMLNGFWKDSLENRKPFDFHLGIGQVYENNSGHLEDIKGFVQNFFCVSPWSSNNS
jgi:hypothetical protein